MNITDNEIRKAWVEHQNFAAVGRQLGVTRQAVRIRILKLRAAGETLPHSKPAGYVLTSERAKQIRQLRGKANVNT